MKKVIKNLSEILVGVAIAGFITSGLYAQEKPKGKPWPVPEADAKKKNPLAGDASAVETGKNVWAQHCKSCHGATGKGDGAKAKMIDISCGDFTSAEFAKVSEGELYWKTTEGRKPMPSYKQKLTDNERWAVVAYMKTLKK